MIYILHDVFCLSLTCRITFDFMAVDSPNGSANLKLTTLLCKRKNGVVFSKCLKKKSILKFVSLLFNVRSFVEFL